LRAEVRADRGGGSPLIYIPGIDGTGELLLETSTSLEERHRLVRMQYLAEPISPSEFPRADTYTGLAGSIAARCAERGLHGALVIAESFGGAVALQLALDNPGLVRGLMIVNSFARFPDRLRLAWALRLSPHLPRSAFDLGRRWLAPASLFGKLREPAAVAAFRALPGTFFDQAYGRRLRMIAGLDLLPRLSELRIPVALVAADRDRIVPSVPCAQEMAAHLPDVTLEVVPGGGHLILPLAAQPWQERLDALAERAPVPAR